MTQDEYKQLSAAGKVQSTQTDTTSSGDTAAPSSGDTGYTLDDFLPMLVKMLQNGGSTSSALGRSHKASGQSIPGQTDTKVLMDTNDFASGVTWDGANNRFTITSAGKYLVTANVYFGSTAANFFFSTMIFKNGSEYSRGIAMSANVSGGVLTSQANDTLDLAVNDYVEIYVYTSDTSAESAGTIHESTYFNIIAVG